MGKCSSVWDFGQAVSRDILTDYKVMVLAVDEAAIQKICNELSLIQKDWVKH